MKLIVRFAALSLMLPISSSFGSATKTFKNVNCDLTNTCDLLGFEIKITEGGWDEDTTFSRQTYMEGFYETKSPDQVEDYAIVQFIKGGLFREHKFDQENIRLINGASRDFFGKKIPFVHPEWVVDSFDNDPIYASYHEKGDRHGLYRIKKDESRSVIYDDSKYFDYYFFRPNLENGRMHFSDLPTGGSYSQIKISRGENAGKLAQTATSSSMEFKTCIFRTSDVAQDAGPKGVDINLALGCLEWENHHVFDWKTREFKKANTIDTRATNENL